MRTLFSIFLCSILFGIQTLYSQDVDAPDISRVSLNPYTNEVLVYWYKSIEPNVDFVRVQYVYDQTSLIKAKRVADVYKNENDSLVFKTDSMVIFVQDAQNAPLSFAVDAYLETGKNSTSLRDYHTLIHCDGVYLNCPSEIELTWTPYEANGIPIDSYQIIEVVGANTENIIFSTNNSQLKIRIPVNTNNTRRLFIRALFKDINGVSQISNSNMVEVQNPVYTPPTYITPQYVSITPINEYSFSCFVDSKSSYSKYSIEISDYKDGPFISIDTITHTKTNTDSLLISYTYPYTNTSKYFKILALDNCNSVIFESQVISPIILTTTQKNELEHTIQWTIPSIWQSGYDSFEIIKEVDIKVVDTIKVAGTENEYSDILTNSYEYGQNICYTIRAIENSPKPNYSFSNKSCINKQYKILIPNTFNPLSSIEENTVFKPKFAFVSGNYTLEIYNRYGARIFISNTISEGWNGYIHGKLAPNAVYNYKITLTMLNGEVFEKIGTIHLLSN